jgi:hypothetical protein
VVLEELSAVAWDVASACSSVEASEEASAVAWDVA